MTIHVNIGEAKTRLSELVAAAKRGEDVVIARAGAPEVRLVPIEPDAARTEIARKRRAFLGSLKGQVADIDWFEPMSQTELALWYGEPLAPRDDDAAD
jgi:prevent-host-death family protein